MKRKGARETQTAIYLVVCKGGTPNPPKAFMIQRPAIALYNREAKRMRMGDTDWDKVTCYRILLAGSPRSKAVSAVVVGSMFSGGMEIGCPPTETEGWGFEWQVVAQAEFIPAETDERKAG